MLELIGWYFTELRADVSPGEKSGRCDLVGVGLLETRGTVFYFF